MTLSTLFFDLGLSKELRLKIKGSLMHPGTCMHAGTKPMFVLLKFVTHLLAIPQTTVGYVGNKQSRAGLFKKKFKQGGRGRHRHLQGY